MTIEHWWKSDGGSGALGDFTGKPHQDISEFAGKKFAIDASIFLNKFLRSDVDKLASTCQPVYICPDLFQKFMSFHQALSGDITPVYVFDGIAPSIKNKTKMKRNANLQQWGQAWLEIVQRAKDNSETVFTEEEIETATESRMKMKKPTALDQANLISWLRKNGIKCYGSLLEADQQMVKLEKDGKVDGIITEDGDAIALGGRLVLAKLEMKNNGRYKCKAFVYNEFMSESNPYRSKLCMYPHLITHISLLLGNDYNEKVENNGAVTVLGKRQKPKDKSSPRLLNGMVDKLAAADNTESWINAYGTNGTDPLSESKKEEYWHAHRYMLHAPVLEECTITGDIKIVTLNPLPEGVSNWVDHFGEDFGLGVLFSDNQMLRDIYECNILPLERKPLCNYTGPMRSGTPTPTSAALFETLFFEEHNLSIQPKMCLINWLRARGLDARFEDSLPYLRTNVKKCELVDRQVITHAPLPPLVGTHNPYSKILTRNANNERDNWNKEYLSIVKKLEAITDDYIDNCMGIIRAGRPSIRFRVMKLVGGGHFHAKTIKCRNMVSTHDGTPCIMFVCECVSSTTSVVHHVYAVFEDKPNGGGSYMKELSSCSCKKGEDFCSHLIGFLFMVHIMQQGGVSSQQVFEDAYRVSPSLVQNVLMLIENAHAPDNFRKQRAQRKRQVNARLSNAEKRQREEDEEDGHLV